MNAYLIICHKNADQVIRLVNRCRSEKTDVYLHADRAMDPAEYHTLETFAEATPGVFLIQKFHGMLDDRSLVDIPLELIRCARKVEAEKGVHYRYYALLSGQDYPIKPGNWIEEQLEQLYPKPLIDCTPYARNNWIYRKFCWSQKLIRIHRRLNAQKRGPVRKLRRVGEILYDQARRCLHRDAFTWLTRMGIDLYGGSAWWILPDQAVRYILEEVDAGREYIRVLLDETWTPEETFFQILTRRSPVGPAMEINPPEQREQNCKTWAYFSDEGKPFRGHPYLFTTAEFEKLRQSECWFARKFDEAADPEILDRIDREILEQPL